MAKANIFIAVMLILSINVVLYTAGIRVIENDNPVVGQFVDTNTYDNNGVLQVTDNFDNAVPRSFAESNAGGVLSFIDTLRAVKEFITFLVNILFTPLGLFVELPSAVALMFGLPLVVASIIALLYFIRSGA